MFNSSSTEMDGGKFPMPEKDPSSKIIEASHSSSGMTKPTKSISFTDQHPRKRRSSKLGDWNKSIRARKHTPAPSTGLSEGPGTSILEVSSSNTKPPKSHVSTQRLRRISFGHRPNCTLTSSGSDHWKHGVMSGNEQKRSTRVSVTTDTKFSLSQLGFVKLQETVYESQDRTRKTRKRSSLSLPMKGPLNVAFSNESDMYIQEMSNSFRKDFMRNWNETAQKKKSLKIRKKWHRAYRKAVMFIYMAREFTSLDEQTQLLTFVDISDMATMAMDCHKNMTLDMEMFRQKKGLTISTETISVLKSVSEERMLVQLEKARRELQKVPVFSEYPLDVQEQVLRQAYYLEIGPKRVILRQGHMPHNFYIIICGQAYVKKYVEDEKTGQMVARTETFLKTGDTFGSESLIRGEERQSTVISRSSMKLLQICGEDFLQLIVKATVPGQLPPYISYIRGMNFMENFPCHLLVGRLGKCSLHHFKRNAIITHDSCKCEDFLIIRHGYCKVFRKLQAKQEIQLMRSMSSIHRNDYGVRACLLRQGQCSEEYIERESPHVSYKDLQTPLGHTVRLPVIKHTNDLSEPLILPDEERMFVPLMLLREGEVFGLDQTSLCPRRHHSRSTILVSLGAEIICLKKNFFVHHAAPEAHEVFKKTFIYDDIFIQQRLRNNSNRDTHLEEVLKFYFHNLNRSSKGRPLSSLKHL